MASRKKFLKNEQNELQTQKKHKEKQKLKKPKQTKNFGEI